MRPLRSAVNRAGPTAPNQNHFRCLPHPNRSRNCLQVALTLLLAGLLLLVDVQAANPTSGGTEAYLVTNAAGSTVSLIDIPSGAVEPIEVGIAPFDLALDKQGKAYVATAEGIAVVDIDKRQRVALIPYQARIGTPTYGEYRHGGMGITVTADGSRVYVAVYQGPRPSRLEIIDTLQKEVVGSVELGIRPFQLLLSENESQLYSIDHDSYSVTVIELADLSARTWPVAPLGYGGFDKPHYAVIDDRGALLLPIQGKVLARLAPANGRIETLPLTGDTHQHGITLSRDKRMAFIVGTGPAGSASSEPSLTIVDRLNGRERLIPLEREHEQIVLSEDGSQAILTGGNSFTGGWDGITVVDLKSGEQRYLPVAGQPLGIRAIGR